MRAQVDLSDEQLAQLMDFSGSKTKRGALEWAVQEAIRSELIKDMFENPKKIDFDPKFLKIHGVANGKPSKRRKSGG